MTEKQITPSVQEMLDEAYNKGVDHAVKTISAKIELLSGIGYRDWEELKALIDYEFNDMASILNALKIKTQSPSPIKDSE